MRGLVVWAAAIAGAASVSFGCFPGPLPVHDAGDASTPDTTAPSDTVVADTEGDDAAGDATDTIEATDATDALDAATVTDAADATDAADTGPECADDSECDRLDGPCVEGHCADGACVPLLETGTTCDDGDPCLAGDVCASGVCAGTRLPDDTVGDRARGFSATKAVIVMGGGLDLDGDDLLVLQVEGAELIRDDPTYPVTYAMPEGARYTLVLVELRKTSLEVRDVVPLLYTTEESAYIDATLGMALLADGSVVVAGAFAGPYHGASGALHGVSPSGFDLDHGIFALRASRSGEALWLREYLGAFSEPDEIPMPRVRATSTASVALAVTVTPGSLLEEVADGVTASTIPSQTSGTSRVDVIDLQGERETALTARGGDGAVVHATGFAARADGAWDVMGLTQGGETTLVTGALASEGPTIPTGVTQGMEAWVARVDGSGTLATFRHFFASGDHPAVVPWTWARHGTGLVVSLTATGGLSSRGPDAEVSATDLPSDTRGALLALDESDKIVARVDTGGFADVVGLEALEGGGVVATLLFGDRVELPTTGDSLTVTETDADAALALATFDADLRATSLVRLAAPATPGDATYGFGSILPMPVWLGTDGTLHVAGSYMPPATVGVTALAPPATGRAAAYDLLLDSDGALVCATVAP